MTYLFFLDENHVVQTIVNPAEGQYMFGGKFIGQMEIDDPSSADGAVLMQDLIQLGVDVSLQMRNDEAFKSIKNELN